MEAPQGIIGIKKGKNPSGETLNSAALYSAPGIHDRTGHAPLGLGNRDPLTLQPRTHEVY